MNRTLLAALLVALAVAQPASATTIFRSGGIPPATESYTLTCIDQRGKVLAQRQVAVDRGEQVDVGDACKKPTK